MSNEIPSKETSRGTIVHYGACRYCGQHHSFEGIIDMTEEEKITKATSMCDCEEAIGETKRLEGVELAKKNVDKLLGKYAFAELLKPFAEELAKFHLDSLTVKVGNVTASMSYKDGKIIVKKKVTDESTLEA
ncbi:hypothetical protein SAMN04487830_12941 [Pseudobutyrivibrio sp. OR37]|uniref:hypothetical protein n=1 Tax=Pseudobutyrivibrio sp. OR37 TaxID=1798186 RepID=UPI0008F08581|nr:hypothetical protein [Pseudobutyrivibrio sp. OR37]SFI19699.1 hypothetical protein SAMN04487830_12941 [Pseudobutyrivibrio sp. OR37]